MDKMHYVLLGPKAAVAPRFPLTYPISPANLWVRLHPAGVFLKAVLMLFYRIKLISTAKVSMGLDSPRKWLTQGIIVFSAGTEIPASISPSEHRASKG